VKEAIQHFTTAVRTRPKNVAGWEALVRCLYLSEFYPEAQQQIQSALDCTNQKTVFVYYLSAVLFAMGKTKEALVQLENAMTRSLKHLRKFIDLNPAILQNPQVVDLIARYKKK
jgi:predicted Zn-dependent protease